MKLMHRLRSLSARTYALVAMVAAALVIPTIILAQGPDRPVYKTADVIRHITFNSITNNPEIGDERDFVGIREKGTTGKWVNSQPVVEGKEYVVQLYVHNNAAPWLNLVAHNVTAAFSVPKSYGTSHTVKGTLSASNATPQSIWDEATFTGTKEFALDIVPGSAQYRTKKGTFTLPDSLFTGGAKLGYDKMDGNISGCFDYAGYLTFVVKPRSPQKPETPPTPVTPPAPVTPPTPDTPTPSEPTPPSVTELPKTGLADVLVGGIGLGAVVTAGVAYMMSRRQG